MEWPISKGITYGEWKKIQNDIWSNKTTESNDKVDNKIN